jgi:hypothetical protein
MGARVAVVDDHAEDIAPWLVDLKPPVRVVVADVGAEGEAVGGLSVFTEVADVERAEYAAADARVAQQVMGGWVHHVTVIPRLVHLPADALGVIDADAESLLGVGKVGVVQHAQQDDRGVLLAYVHRLRRVDAGGNQEREGGDAAHLHAVVVVNLDERLVVTERVNLAHVSRFVDQVSQNRVGRAEVVVQLGMLDGLAQCGKDALHRVLRRKSVRDCR